MEVFSAFFVQLDPSLRFLLETGITFVFAFLLLQVAARWPALAEYIGQYKAGIITWLSSIAVQLIQAQLNKIPLEWESVTALVMKLIVEVVVVLAGFAVVRRAQFKGFRALQ
jgi:hypothetical protein